VKAPYEDNSPYLAGETVTPGKFKCERCGCTVQIEHVTNLPVCPDCQHDRWQGRDRIAFG
jgi:Zn finger protein HypA/HybF involved in hydrogenase expression